MRFRQGENLQLVGQMNALLNALIEKEIGRDDGRELPDIEGVSWEPGTGGDKVLLD